MQAPMSDTPPLPRPDPAPPQTPTRRGAYDAHRGFVAPARAHAALKTLVIGVIAIEVINSALRAGLEITADAAPGLSAHMIWYGSHPLGLLIQLFSFVFLAAGVILVAQLLHRRGLRSLTGPPAILWRHLAWVFLACMVLFAVMEAAPPHWPRDQIAMIRPWPVWLSLLPLGLMALLVQTGAEELFYRGYIQQQLAARFDHPLVWMGLTNVLFALAHWQPGDFSIGSVQYIIWAFCFGLACSDLTARTGTLGAALGFHLANNTLAFLFVGEEMAPDSGLALVLFTPGVISGGGGDDLIAFGFALELLGVALMWAVARLILRR